MSFAFQHHHGAMLLKYSGISFISGAVNHGFFSGERSLWTAVIGIVLFVLGALLEHRLSDSPQERDRSLMRTLTLGTLLSIGLGFFTGGLQHFPDSPARSAWVVPLGFAISVPALALSGGFAWRRSSTVYVWVLSVLVAGLSYGAWQWLERNPQWGHGGHAHGHHAPSSEVVALQVARVIEVRMDDQMRFYPDQLEVQAGQAVRLVVHNAGRLPHELVLGSAEQIREHAQQMKQGQAHAHNHGAAGAAAIEVEPGKTGELVLRFAQPGRFEMACLIPGHYEAGMRGSLTVVPASTAASSTSQPAAKPGGHDHSSHKH
jgi:uncharacterized cupredoxin-like copper-binding protein